MTDDAACCAAFYDEPAVRYLLGDALHPGGVASSLALAEHCALSADARVLDVACGRGTTLRALRQRYAMTAVGIDASPPAESDLELARGDVHDLPFDDQSFDAVFCECALSTFVDQPRALREIHRVLSAGGHLALSDMIVDGQIPDALKDWVHVGTCLTRACSIEEYGAMLQDAGLSLVASWSADDALRSLLSQIKRRLVGAALARASGVLPPEVNIDVALGRDLLRAASSAIDEGRIGYHAFVARKN